MKLFLLLLILGMVGCVSQDQGVTSEAKPTAKRSLSPTFTDLSYGPHKRNNMNVWLAESDRPTPVVVLIHGGGWCTGNKVNSVGSKGYVAKGISVVSINYRLLLQAPLPAPLHDAARALQFIRFKATEWNIDKNKIACIGGSAGGATSYWLAFHDDLANPASDDPVERESSKPTCIAVNDAQSAIDPVTIKEWIGPAVLRHAMIIKSLGHKKLAAMMADYDKNKETYKKYSAYFHLDKNDPPVYMTYMRPATVPAKNKGHGIHHPVFGMKVKEKMDQLGVEAHLRMKGVTPSLKAEEFIYKHLGK